jgi:outer membrane biosynthesis protein TonB
MCNVHSQNYFHIFSVKDGSKDGKIFLEVVTAEHTKLMAMVNEVEADEAQLEVGEEQPAEEGPKKRKGEEVENEPVPKAAKVVAPDKDEKKKEKRDPKAADIMVQNI